jgi:hypothetical protein
VRGERRLEAGPGDGEIGQADDQRLDQAGIHVEPQGAADVERGGARAAVAEPGVVHHLAGIAARPREGEVERAGGRRLRPAGIGRAVLPGVAQHDAEGGANLRLRRGEGGGGEERAAEPGRDQVQDVVEPRRRPAEADVARRGVADHAVERVDRLVDEDPRQSEERVIEDRRHHAVAEILGQRLDGGAGDAVFVEALRVAADDMADRRAPGDQSLAVERLAHARHMVEETALRQQYGDEQNLDRPAEGEAAQDRGEHEPEHRRCCHQRRDCQDAAHQACPLVAPLAVEMAVEPIDGAADQRHGMRHHLEKPRQIAQRDVQGEGREQQKQLEPGRGVQQHRRAGSGRAVNAVNRLCAATAKEQKCSQA